MNASSFTFSCPHCGQHLEAEPDWVGMEVECPTCGKALAVPPQPPPVITVMSKPKLLPVSGRASTDEGNQIWWKKMPKWVYGMAGVAVLAIIGLAIAVVLLAKNNTSSDGHLRTDDNVSTSVPNDAKTTEKPTYAPRLDIKPLGKDRESAQWVKSCNEADWKEVMRFPDDNKGKPFYIEGKITHVMPPDPMANNHRGAIMIEQDGDWKRKWIVLFDDERTLLPEGNMLEGDEITVYGLFEKVHEWTGKNAFNAERTERNPRIIARVIANALADIAAMFHFDVGEDDDSEANSNSLTQAKRHCIGNTLNFLSTIEANAASVVKKLFGKADGTVTDVLKCVVGLVLANKLENENGWYDCPYELQNAIKKVAMARGMANVADVIKKHGAATVKSVLERYKVREDYVKRFEEATKTGNSAIAQELHMAEFQFRGSVAKFDLGDEYLTSLIAMPMDDVTVEVTDVITNELAE